MRTGILQVNAACSVEPCRTLLPLRGIKAYGMLCWVMQDLARSSYVCEEGAAAELDDCIGAFSRCVASFTME